MYMKWYSDGLTGLQHINMYANVYIYNIYIYIRTDRENVVLIKHSQ